MQDSSSEKQQQSVLEAAQSSSKTSTSFDNTPGDLAVEDLAKYYAASKPPGRKYPVDMSSDMTAAYIGGEPGSVPEEKNAGNETEKNKGDK